MSHINANREFKMSKINVAVVGVGNCCSALVQGVHHYAVSKRKRNVGLMSERVGRYRVADIEFVTAIDVNSEKIGRDLSDAIFLSPNNTSKFSEVPKIGVTVRKGPLLDGLGYYSKGKVPVDPSMPVDVSNLLRETKAEILVNLLPTGATKATKFYAKEALDAGCAFLNATPTKLAADQVWQRKFSSARLQLVGDDIKNQVGSTILHESILRMLARRGVKIDESYQLDIGGGMESLNALERERYWIKRKIKIKAVSSAIPYKFPMVAGSSDYVEFMKNSRTSHFWVKGEYFGQTEFTLDMTLNVGEGPACAAVLVDIIRALKLTKDRRITGVPLEVCAYGFKMPPKPLPFDEATRFFHMFAKDQRSGKVTPRP
jgi:myo-inositol-1-phosphate synthase